MKVVEHRNLFSHIKEVVDDTEIKAVIRKLIERACILLKELKKITEYLKIGHIF